MQKIFRLVWGRQWSLTWLILTPSVTNSLTLECRIPAQQQGLWEVGDDTYKARNLGTHTVSVDHLQEHYLGSWWERHVPGYPRPVDSVSASQPDPQGLWVHIKAEKHCSLLCVGVLSRVWLFNPTDCSPPGSSVYGIFQARILEWVDIPSSRGSSWPRDQTRVSCISCIGRWIL